METKNRLIPFIATHPGDVLREELKERGITQKEFSKATGINATQLNEIIKRKRRVNADIALKIEAALGISARFWMDMQSDYDYNIKAIAARNEANEAAAQKEAAYKVYFNLSAIYKYFKTNIYSAVERLKTLLSLIPYEELSQETIEELCFEGRFKRSDKAQVDEKNVRTWQIIARKICADARMSVPFTKGNANEAAEEIAKMANAGVLTEEKIRICLEGNGIFYFVLEKLDKAPIDAYSVMIGGRPSIVVTHRYNDMDKLAFDVLHELCHIERHITEGKSFVSVSIDGVDYSRDPLEVEANTYARNMLISPQIWKEIMNAGSKNISPTYIVEIIAKEARKRGINPTIAVSRYKHDSKHYDVAQYRSPKIR